MGAYRGAGIMHVDLDAFYASVEQRDHPHLRGKPIAVGGGVVLAASYEARRFGVRSGMPGGQARKLCPGLINVRGHMDRYVEASREVFDVCRTFTPFVEPISIDEAFLDVTGAVPHFGPPVQIGTALRAAIRAATDLPASVGIATTKFFAKVLSRTAKPDGLVVVERSDEIEFLHMLDVAAIWGVGPVQQRRLAGYGIRTVGDLAAVPLPALEGMLGKGSARHLHALAWNRDPRRVSPGGRAGSVGGQSTFGRDSRDPGEHRKVLLRLAERVGRRLRAKGRTGRTVTLRVRFADFVTITRSRTLPATIDSTEALYRIACDLLDEVMASPVPEGRGLRLLGIAISQLDGEGPIQPELPLLFTDDDPSALTRAGSGDDLARRRLDEAVDGLRNRYGKEAVRRAILLRDREHRFVIPPGGVVEED
jgi:DNA polymerase IV